MTDIIDAAKDTEIKQREAALKRQLNKPKPTPRIIDGVRYCLDCEEPINIKRVMANNDAARCIQCQESLERRGG